MASFKRLLRWELERSFRFPMFEFILAIMLYRALWTMLLSGGGWGYGALGGLPTLIEVYESFTGSLVALHVGLSMANSYLFLAITYSALASRLADELSTGGLRLILSYPLSRRQVFMAKLFAYFITPLILFLAIYTALMIWVGGSVIAYISPSLLAAVYGLACIELLYIFTITLSMALLTRNTLVGFTSSLFLLTGLEYAANEYGEPLNSLIPPRSMREALVLMRGGNSPPLETIIIPIIISAILLVVCYSYFNRRLEV